MSELKNGKEKYCIYCGRKLQWNDFSDECRHCYDVNEYGIRGYQKELDDDFEDDDGDLYFDYSESW